MSGLNVGFRFALPDLPAASSDNYLAGVLAPTLGTLNITKLWLVCKMVDFTIINKIRNEVSRCSSKLLDRQLINEHDLKYIVEYLSTDFLSETKYIDLPIRSVASMNRMHETWHAGNNWRDVIRNGIRGENWPMDIFDYFDGEIYDKCIMGPGL